MSSRKARRIAYSQNFLRNPSVARRLVESASITRSDTVFEIGSGTGMLTREIARKAGRVIAVEIDPDLAEATRERTAPFRNVDITCADVLEVPLPDQPYRVLANIPYNATAAIIEKLTNGESPPVDCHLVVQRESADRYIGDPKTTLQSVLLFPWFEMAIKARLRRSDFMPRPRVDSVLLRIGTREDPLVDSSRGQLFRDFVTFGFTAWQPDLRTAYSHVFTGNVRREIEVAGIDLSRRPSEVDREEWLELFWLFADYAPPVRQRRVKGAQERLKAQQKKLAKSHRSRVGK